MGPGTPLTDIHYLNNINLTQLQISDHMVISGGCRPTGRAFRIRRRAGSSMPAPICWSFGLSRSIRRGSRRSRSCLGCPGCGSGSFRATRLYLFIFTQLPRIALQVLQAVFLLTCRLLLLEPVHLVQVVGRDPKFLMLKMLVLIDCPRWNWRVRWARLPGWESRSFWQRLVRLLLHLLLRLLSWQAWKSEKLRRRRYNASLRWFAEWLGEYSSHSWRFLGLWRIWTVPGGRDASPRRELEGRSSPENAC